ncbi:MAG TPA: AmmeMemoRadiSam system radical SAM enzyme [Sandaracinaceae bacterium LLY-WYZ-13_1]|nr:AmmeMemoRadiSam system radical SAM enzyme [Sandaracinaceae bacterium LLY-WYZ-13_1]
MRGRELIEPGTVEAEWWRPIEGGRLECDLCPRRCTVKDGQHGFCFVRENRGGRMVLSSYGRSTGVAIDPIEKKPLSHFHPGSTALSFGTAGCCLGCRFCQNWDISKSRDVRRLSETAPPEALVSLAEHAGCRSIAYTYNDPIIFAEYAIDTAELARERGIANVAVTSGYISPPAREAFFGAMDAANVDLKAFSEEFYRKLCFARLGPVLETLEWIVRETDVWLEVTTLLIPGHNDSDEELDQLATWCAEHLGPEVPLHLSAFHPAYQMRDVPPTPPSTLIRARERALAAGMKHVYTGNVVDPAGQSTYCAGCGERVIERDGYVVTAWHLTAEGACRACGRTLAGRFDGPPPRRGRRIL